MIIGAIGFFLCCLGGIVALVGLIILILGLVMEDDKKRRSQQYYVPMPQPPQQYQAGQPQAAPNAVFCPYCQAQNAPGTQVCWRCFRKFA